MCYCAALVAYSININRFAFYTWLFSPPSSRVRIDKYVDVYATAMPDWQAVELCSQLLSLSVCSFVRLFANLCIDHTRLTISGVILTLNIIVTLKCALEVTQDHSSLDTISYSYWSKIAKFLYLTSI